MKIKTITFIAVLFSITAHVQANPFEFISNVINVATCQPMYHDAPNSSANWVRDEDRPFKKKVTYFDGYEYTKGAPPPDAFVYVTYPGPAPKHLYNNPNFDVMCDGAEHTVIYRKPGW